MTTNTTPEAEGQLCPNCGKPGDHLRNGGGEVRVFYCQRRERAVQAAKDLAITMSYDAMRICFGQKPKNHTVDDVLRWMRLISNTAESNIP